MFLQLAGGALAAAFLRNWPEAYGAAAQGVAAVPATEGLPVMLPTRLPLRDPAPNAVRVTRFEDRRGCLLWWM